MRKPDKEKTCRAKEKSQIALEEKSHRLEKGSGWKRNSDQPEKREGEKPAGYVGLIKSNKPDRLYKAVPIPDNHKIICCYKDAYGFYNMLCKSPPFP